MLFGSIKHLPPFNRGGIQSQLKFPVMKSITVTFGYSTNTNDFTIEAVVTPGAKSINCQFDRFQEPDDEDAAEITEVTDEDGVDHIAEFVFTGKQIREIEAIAIEKASEESEPEYED